MPPRENHTISVLYTRMQEGNRFHLEWRKRWGERLTDDSPLFRSDHNSQVEYFDKDRRRVKSFQTVLSDGLLVDFLGIPA